MRRSIAVVGLVLTPLVVFAQSGSPARDPFPPLEQQPTGTGRITVAVVGDDTGAPIKRVRVALNGVLVPRQPTADRYAQRTQREAETDEAARAEFARLPAAFYSVGAQMPPSGYVRQSLSKGQQLKDGEAASITIRLLRAGAIMGRVLDDAGEPLARVSVRAIRKDPG